MFFLFVYFFLFNMYICFIILSMRRSSRFFNKNLVLIMHQRYQVEVKRIRNGEHQTLEILINAREFRRLITGTHISY